MAEAFERWITSPKGVFWFRTVVFGTCTIGWLAWGTVQSSLTRIEAKQDGAVAKIEAISSKLQGMDKNLALNEQLVNEHSTQISVLQGQQAEFGNRLVRVELSSEAKGKK